MLTAHNAAIKLVQFCQLMMYHYYTLLYNCSLETRLSHIPYPLGTHGLTYTYIYTHCIYTGGCATRNTIVAAAATDVHLPYYHKS